MVRNLDGCRLVNGRLADGSRSDFLIRGGLLADAANASEPAPSEPVLDLGGQLVLPGLVEGHLHLDKTLLGTPWRPHAAGGTVRDRVAYEKAVRRDLDVPVGVRADVLLRRCLTAGTTRVRTHVDIDELVRLDGLEALLAVRQDWSERIDIEIVAFPQSGLISCPAARDLLPEALRAGADLVGGLDPVGFDNDLAGHLDVVFGLAERFGRGIDIHLHDGGEAGLAEIEAVAARTRAAGLTGRVTISHAFALAEAGPDRLTRMADLLREAGVAIASSIPGGANCPPLLALAARGVRVFFGSDNVRDAWNPASIVGMLDRAMLCSYRFGLRRDQEIEPLLQHVTSIPRAVMGCPEPLRPGGPADFIVLRAETVAEAVVERMAPTLVVKDGRAVQGSAEPATAPASQTPKPTTRRTS